MECEWCRAAPATTEVETEAAKFRKDKRSGARVIAKVAKKIKCCRECKATVERQLEAARRAKETASKGPVEDF